MQAFPGLPPGVPGSDPWNWLESWEFLSAIPVLGLQQCCFVTRCSAFHRENWRKWQDPHKRRTEVRWTSHLIYDMCLFDFVWTVALWFLRYVLLFYVFFVLFLCAARSFERLRSLAIPVFRWCRSCVAHIWRHLGSRGRVLLDQGMQRENNGKHIIFPHWFLPLCLCGELELSY